TNGLPAIAKEPARIKTLHVNGETVLRPSAQLQVSYEVIHPFRAIFDPDELALAKMANGRPILFAIDANVFALYGDEITAYARKHLCILGKVLTDATEEAKTWNTVKRVLEAGFHQSLPRNGLI